MAIAWQVSCVCAKAGCGVSPEAVCQRLVQQVGLVGRSGGGASGEAASPGHWVKGALGLQALPVFLSLLDFHEVGSFLCHVLLP